jgi:hypothetical protein
MRTPGFSADASLYTGGGHYVAIRGVGRRDGMVLPQRICHQECLDDCVSLCPDPSDCQDLPNPGARLRCVQYAVRCRVGCFHRCCH